MKGFLVGVFWIGIVIVGWRFVGPSASDMSDRLACRYKNSSDDCLTQTEYIKMVARDAATDAINGQLAYCGSYASRSDPTCAVFHKQ